jgi:altronate hydrolase
MGTAGKLIRINENDNVAVALCPLKKGEIHPSPAGGDSLVMENDIPGGPKIALRDIEAGDRIVKYGYPIGAASIRITRGAYVHTHNLRTLLTEGPEYHYHPIPMEEWKYSGDIPEISVFRRGDGSIGIRNEIWIIPTVGCVNKTAEVLARWGNREFAGEAIDGIYAWTHPYGCSQMGDDHEATKTILADLAKHPNAAAVLILSLGCENNTISGFKEALGSYAEDTGRTRPSRVYSPSPRAFGKLQLPRRRRRGRPFP